MSLDNQVEDICHIYAPYTDHKAVNLILRTQESARGKGAWKMNTSNILNEQYKQELTELWTHWQSKKPLYNDIKIWWDIGKRHIKNMTKDFSKGINRERRSKLKALEERINSLKQNENNNEELKPLQEEYENIHSKETEGAKIRSRIQWWEEGEKSSKYFHNLEKRNGKDKAWTQILDKDDQLQYGTDSIQKVQVEFYRSLYTSQNLRNNDKSYFLENLNTGLSEDSKKQLESNITKFEVLKAIKKMPNNKSPGQDGIPIEFYKLLWNVVGEDLINVYHKGLDDEQLSYNQYLAISLL